MSNSDLKLYMYIAVNRPILTLPQCAVQACHALHEFLAKCDRTPSTQEWLRYHKTIVIVEATKPELFKLMEKFEGEFACFFEPDLGDELTAIAFEPRNQPSKLLLKLNLLH